MDRTRWAERFLRVCLRIFAAPCSIPGSIKPPAGIVGRLVPEKRTDRGLKTWPAGRVRRRGGLEILRQPVERIRRTLPRRNISEEILRRSLVRRIFPRKYSSAPWFGGIYPRLEGIFPFPGEI